LPAFPSGLMICRILTGSIEEVSKSSGLNKAFLGLIILPIAGNACEHITAGTGKASYRSHYLSVCRFGCPLSFFCSNLRRLPSGADLGLNEREKVSVIDECLTQVAGVPFAVVVAAKDKMDLAIGVALGSSIQIAIFVIPFVGAFPALLSLDLMSHFSRMSAHLQ
jgi:Ca2+/Na+ antiporter